MKSLSETFCSTVCNTGMGELRHPVFYNAPVGIRFEIGAEESAYLRTDGEEFIKNPKYVEKALKRVKSIYENLPKKPNILRIDAYPDEIQAEELVMTICKVANLPSPHEMKTAPFQWEGDDEILTQLQLYWDLNRFDFNVDRLLEEIIKADLGGCNFFSSSVYLVDTDNIVMYYVYDDRGADLIAKNKESLYPLFIQFNSWILEYDREQIYNTFLKK